MNSVPVLAAMCGAAQASGIRLEENSMDSDAVVIWSVLWAGRMRNNQAVYQHYRHRDRPVIIVDVGSLHRGHTWKVAVNNLTAAGYYGHDRDLDPDRPRKLNLVLGAPRRRRPEILLAAQHNRSLQAAGLGSMESWVRQQVNRLRQHSDRPVTVRPHPRSPLDWRRLQDLPGVQLESPHRVAGTYDDFDLGFTYHAMVNHNSGVGIRAALAGCAPIVDNTSLAAPVAISISDLERDYDVDRQDWLISISHTEYTIEELAQGTWLKRLSAKL